MSQSPTDNLTAPEPDDPVPDMVELATNANAVSPAYWLNGIIKTITGFDALTIITDYVAGDWAAMQKAGTAIENLAKYNADYAVGIDSAVKEFEASWRGNAAENSRTYFASLTDGLNKQVDPLQQIADEIKAFRALVLRVGADGLRLGADPVRSRRDVCDQTGGGSRVECHGSRCAGGGSDASSGSVRRGADDQDLD